MLPSSVFAIEENNWASYGATCNHEYLRTSDSPTGPTWKTASGSRRVNQFSSNYKPPLLKRLL